MLSGYLYNTWLINGRGDGDCISHLAGYQLWLPNRQKFLILVGLQGVMFEDNVVMCHLGIKALSQEDPFDISLFNELILKHVFHVNK